MLIILLTEFIKINVNMNMIIKKCQICGIKVFECCLEYINAKDDLIECKHLCCNKNYQKKFDENLKERFANTYRFSSHYINEFILLCKKVFTLMNTLMIRKNSMKHHYQRKKIFTVT